MSRLRALVLSLLRLVWLANVHLNPDRQMPTWLLRLLRLDPASVQSRTARRLVRSTDHGKRVEGIHLLAQLGDEAAARGLSPLLEDPYSSVRTATRQALRELGPVAREVLLQGLNHARPEVGQVSAELLGELEDPAVVQPLLVALKFATRPVQLAARRALERLGPLAHEQLRSAVQETQPWVARQIQEILAKAPEVEGAG